MKNQSIKLDCGHEVEVIAIDISRTYGEILAGSPSFEDNVYVYENLKAPERWGKRKTVMNQESFNLDLKHFKKYTVYLWLSSSKSIDDPFQKFDGSELVVVWALDDLFSFSINSLIDEGIKEFNWETYAVNTQI
ncbi:hypothetical protein Q361_10726 [Flavobacterium croceum DSM 17960]|uniref:Uncharacterized protein n=1 Tax=Flavobacterium croceum DSM 17960 TaxID=1121886 RepID=A0A2S4N820_9FLAO|nr:hypothetical protein [Flavobacterium croceum]POS01836.1 hypothetical protein Q361_10726 [Flavobacterium croceum DSM 17960]